LSDTGLIVLGVVLLIIGILTSWFCVGIPIAIAGFVILIYGAVKEERPVMMYPPMYTVPAVAPAVCPACGTPLQWVAQYQRWFCPRCNAYR
jgi:hypothetical protein